MQRRKVLKHVQNGLIGTVSAVFAGTLVVPKADTSGPLLTAAMHAATRPAPAISVRSDDENKSTVATATTRAVDALKAAVHPLSHPKALETAFRSYFAYKATHPNDVKKPYLYF